MEQDRKHRLAVLVALDGLHRARLAEHDRIDRFEVRRVGQQRQMDLVAVELAVRRGAEVIFDVARAADIGGIGRAAGEFVEDRAIGLAHDVGEDVEAAAVGHADVDLARRPSAPPYLITASSAGTALSPPSRPKRLVPTYLRARNFSHCSAWMTLARIDCLPSGVNWTVVVRALDPLLDEAPLLQVVDVHIFEADVAAVGVLQHLDDLAHGRLLEAERAADPDRPVEVGVGEAVIGRA